ncbi:MAG: hypothetical protein SGBAC_003372 [Bacillariaceae sp.]
MSQRLFLALSLLLMVVCATGFVPYISSVQGSRLHAETSPEAAAALTDYMAKAHQEKVAAMARVEAQYKDEIEALKAQVAELQGPTTAESNSSSNNSFAFPATNRGLAEKVVSYQKFISKYVVKAQAEKQKAVKVAEQTTAATYKAKIEAMSVPPLQ